MSEIVLSRIFVYPIKSLGGVELTSAVVEPRGLQYDRRWMLVDAQGVFLTQRKIPRMALARVEIRAEHLVVSADSAGSVEIPLALPEAQPTVGVQVWSSSCEAQIVSDSADEWFSDFLGMDCRLVYMPESTRRAVNPEYARHSEIVSFADGYPVLLVGQSSLDQLNAHLEQPVPLDRFRPNLVTTGEEAFAEYHWRRIATDAATFQGTKPCERCVVTTIEQSTGVPDGPEPLKTLAKISREQNKTVFGQNLMVQQAGVVRIGDEMAVESDWPID